MDRIEIDAFKIDLIRSGQAAIPGEIIDHAGERGQTVELQHSCGAIECDRRGIGDTEFEYGASPYCGGSDGAGKGTRDLEGCAGHDIDPDGAVAIEVLVEGGLYGLHRGAVACRGCDEVRQVVAIAVGAPHRIQAAAGVMPRDVITTTRNLDCPDRRPGAELARGDGYATLFELGAGAGAGAGAGVVEKETITDLS